MFATKRSSPGCRKSALHDSPDWVEGEDVVVPTVFVYGPDEPVEIVVRKRGWRFDISDGARAVELAGRPKGWQDVAEQVVETYWLNVNRCGVVLVQATSTGSSGSSDASPSARSLSSGSFSSGPRIDVMVEARC